MSQTIVVTGATGFIGRTLCRALADASYRVVGLTRNVSRGQTVLDPPVNLVAWDARTANDWGHYADGALAIVNLAGERIIDFPWTAARKKRILKSRLDATHAVMQAIESATIKPKVLIQASATGFYGPCGDDDIDDNAPSGIGYLADVCRQWEDASLPAESMGVRRVLARIGVVLGRDGGMLKKILPAFRGCLGAQVGAGRHGMPWVHIDDVASAIRFLIEHDQLTGAFNVTAPEPVSARAFYQALGHAIHRPVCLRVPACLAKLMFGQIADELLLSGQRAVPKRLTDSGYEFQYSQLDNALTALV